MSSISVAQWERRTYAGGERAAYRGVIWERIPDTPAGRDNRPPSMVRECWYPVDTVEPLTAEDLTDWEGDALEGADAFGFAGEHNPRLILTALNALAYAPHIAGALRAAQAEIARLNAALPPSPARPAYPPAEEADHA